MWESVKGIQFSAIEKILHTTPYEWEELRIKHAVEDYRKMLYLYGTQTVGPLVSWNEDLDAVWRLHVLCLQVYLGDCVKLFNEPLYRDESQAVVLAYGKGNAYTAMVFERNFQAPHNTPYAIKADYDLTGHTIPWLVWWKSYTNIHKGSEEKYSYDPIRHTFEPMVLRALKSDETASFFRDE